MCYRGVIEEAEDVRSFLSKRFGKIFSFCIYYIEILWKILIIETVFPLHPPFLRIQRASIKNPRKSFLGVNENNTLSTVTAKVRSWRLMTHISCHMAFQRKNEGQRPTGSYTAICPLIDDNILKNIFIFKIPKTSERPPCREGNPARPRVYMDTEMAERPKGQRIKKAAYTAAFV